MIKETQKGLQCCSEVHLHKSGLALAVYNKIGALTKGGENGGTYFTTLEPLADLFSVSPNSIWRVATWMTKIGFLEKLPSTNKSERAADCFLSKQYRYVSHDEWAGNNPGQCYEALDPNWDDLSEPLAKELWKSSKGNTRWYLNQLACLRNTGWNDDRIVEEWEDHLAQLEKPCVYRGQWKSAQGTFLKKLKQLAQPSDDTPAEE
jgi:hypothetical protein